jgi:hypothetical protein
MSGKVAGRARAPEEYPDALRAISDYMLEQGREGEAMLMREAADWMAMLMREAADWIVRMHVDPVAGQIYHAQDTDDVYVFDGSRWRLMGGPLARRPRELAGLPYTLRRVHETLGGNPGEQVADGHD